jgi:inhibitor of cysteine peptidase
MKLTENDAGSSIHLREGEVLEIVLTSNPSTGYRWEVAPGEETLLEQQGDWEFKPASRAVGAGGIITLRFKAVRKGEADFKLIYHRPFEPEAPPVQSFEIKLVVGG